MRMRIRRAILAIGFLVAQSTWAVADLSINELIGFASTKQPYSIEYLDAQTDTDGDATCTTTNQFGSADDNREIFIVGATSAVASRTANSFTVGGIAGTLSTVQYGGATGQFWSGFAQVPAGASGTVAVTMSGVVTNCVIATFRVISRPGVGTNTDDSATATQAGGTTCTTNAVTVNADGFILANGSHNNTNTSTDNVFTDAFEVTIGGTIQINVSYYPIQAASSTPTNVNTWTGSTTGRCNGWAYH